MSESNLTFEFMHRQKSLSFWMKIATNEHHRVFFLGSVQRISAPDLEDYSQFLCDHLQLHTRCKTSVEKRTWIDLCEKRKKLSFNGWYIVGNVLGSNKNLKKSVHRSLSRVMSPERHFSRLSTSGE